MKGRVSVTGGDEIPGRLRASLESNKSQFTAGMRRAVLLVHASAVKAIQKGPKTGHIYGKHQASAPGEAPAADTGVLTSNIVPDVITEGNDIIGVVSSRAKYSAWLEFGTADMEPRPFMRPALEENRRKIVEILRKETRG